MTLLALLGAAFVLIALFVTPHDKPFSTQVDLALMPRAPRVLEITAPAANIDIVIADFQKPQMIVEGESHGFGLPGSRLDLHSIPCRADSHPKLPDRGARLDHRSERFGHISHTAR